MSWQRANRLGDRSMKLEALEDRHLLTTLPPGFVEVQVHSRLDEAPVSVVQTPDGRLLVTYEDDEVGAVKVIEDGVVHPNHALELDIVSDGELGMLGMLVDPEFEENNFLYLYYTTAEGGRHNRLSRFEMSGDTIDPDSEFILMDFDLHGPGENHNGGGMVFGPDGKLYIGIGENGNPANASNINNRFGTIVRLNPDGSIPSDNPYYRTASGDNRAIYAIGVRNPFTMDVDSRTGRIFFNDVGPGRGEEINEVVYDADYGWPTEEGININPAFTDPVHSYAHGIGVGTGCAITGGTFVRPDAESAFPQEYRDKYFFIDYCSGWIDTYDLKTGQVEPFASDLAGSPVSIISNSDGDIFYASRENRAIMKISYRSEVQLEILAQPQDTTVAVGERASFSVDASPRESTSYRWQSRSAGRAWRDIAGANARIYNVDSATARDDQTEFRVIVRNNGDSLTSEPATLNVLLGSAPDPVITLPNPADTYVAGDVIEFAGFATDVDEDGRLPAGSLTWEVTFQHDTHYHPHTSRFSGADGGTFTVPTVGETSDNVWFRIHLTATDSTGLESYVFHDIFPEKSTFTIDSNIEGIQLTLDGSPIDAPLNTRGVVGVLRSIGAPATQVVGGVAYEFVEWSDGGNAIHDIATPTQDRTYTAIYEAVDTAPTPDPDPDPTPAPNPTPTPAPSSEVAGAVTHFRLDELSGTNGADSASEGVSDVALLASGATWAVDGRFGAAVRLDGVDDYLSVPDSQDFNLRDVSKTTIGFWFNADDVDRETKQVLFKQGGQSRGLNVYLDSGSLYVGGWSDKANWLGTYLTTDQITSDRWHHVTLVLDADGTLARESITGYLDGVAFDRGQAATIKEQQGNVSFGAIDQGTRFHDGESDGPTALSPFAGLIDEIQVFRRPLTNREVAILASEDVKLAIDNLTQLESNSGVTDFVFTISLDEAANDDVTVQVNTEDALATGGIDYRVLSNHTATIPAGELSTNVTVEVFGEMRVEPDETFRVVLSEPKIGGQADPARVEFQQNTAVGIITNDDHEHAHIEIDSVAQMETDTDSTEFLFRVWLEEAVSEDVTVDLTTSDGSAEAGSDYTPLEGYTATIPAGDIATFVAVQISGDTDFEPNETFSVALSNPKYNGISNILLAEIHGLPATGTIQNDDLPAGSVTHFEFDDDGEADVDLATEGVEDQATLINGARLSEDGVFGGSVRFDGVDDHVAIADSTDLNLETISQTSISFWFKADDVDRDAKQVLYKQRGRTRGLNVYLDGGRLYVGGWSDKASWAGTFLSTDQVTSGKWHHVALVLDAPSSLSQDGSLTQDAMHGYLDGELFGSGEAASIKKHRGNVSLGANDQGTRFHTGDSRGPLSLSPFAGWIDDFHVFNRPLTPTEVDTLAGLADFMDDFSLALFAISNERGKIDSREMAKTVDSVVTFLR